MKPLISPLNIDREESSHRKAITLTKREKMGFSVPIHEWIRGPLSEWCEELLNKDRLKSEGFFDEEIVCNKWKEHLFGKKNNITFLWPILMFQSWLENQ